MSSLGSPSGSSTAPHSTPPHGHRQQGNRLPGYARWLLGTVGVLMLSAGAVAVFTRENEGGPTALIAIGATLVVLAAMGTQISRLKVGDNEIDWQEARDQVAAAVEEAPAAQALAVIEGAAAYDPGVLSNATIAASAHSSYEALLLDQLKSQFGSAAVTEVRPGPRRGQPDAFVRLGDTRIAVEALYGNPDQAAPWTRLSKVVTKLVAGDASAIVVVSNMCEPSLHTLERVAETAGAAGKAFTYVRWADPVHNAALQQAVEVHRR